MEAQNGAMETYLAAHKGVAKAQNGVAEDSVDQWLQIPITLNRIRININVKVKKRSDPDQHQGEKSDPDPHRSEETDPKTHHSEKSDKDRIKVKGVVSAQMDFDFQVSKKSGSALKCADPQQCP